MGASARPRAWETFHLVSARKMVLGRTLFTRAAQGSGRGLAGSNTTSGGVANYLYAQVIHSRGLAGHERVSRQACRRIIDCASFVFPKYHGRAEIGTSVRQLVPQCTSPNAHRHFGMCILSVRNPIRPSRLPGLDWPKWFRKRSYKFVLRDLPRPECRVVLNLAFPLNTLRRLQPPHLLKNPWPTPTRWGAHVDRGGPPAPCGAC